MDSEELALERERLSLERERLEIEKLRQKSETKFSQRNSAALISAAVSLAAVIVSASQVWVAHVGKAKEIEIAQLQKRQELMLASSEQDRRWKLDVLKFVMTNTDRIFSNSVETRSRIRDVMLVTFPPEITDALFKKLELTAKGNEKSTWKEGRDLSARIAASSAEPAATESYMFYMKIGIQQYELRNKASIESFKRALDFRPNDPIALYYLAAAYSNILNDKENASRYLREAMSNGFKDMDRINIDGLATLLNKAR